MDGIYLGGKWRNKRLKIRKFAGKQKRGRGTLKHPVFVILCRDGQVWAEIVQDVEAIDLQPIIERKVKKGSTVYSDGWRAYTGIATKGYVHRLVDHGKEQYSDKRGGHINGLEGFWGYLKRKRVARGGIRKERLPLFLGEYVWRCNHRKIQHTQRIKSLFRLLTGVQY